MIYTVVNPHAVGDGPRPEDAHADARPAVAPPHEALPAPTTTDCRKTDGLPPANGSSQPEREDGCLAASKRSPWPEGPVEIQLSLRLSVSQTITNRRHYSHSYFNSHYSHSYFNPHATLTYNPAGRDPGRAGRN
jgi:hypothetical protein